MNFHIFNSYGTLNGGISMLDVYKFHAMTREEHIESGHYMDSTGNWVDPKDYISSYFADW